MLNITIELVNGKYSEFAYNNNRCNFHNNKHIKYKILHKKIMRISDYFENI